MRHAVARVAHFDARLAAEFVKPKPNCSGGIGGVERVLNHMSDDSFEPLFVPARNDGFDRSNFQMAPTATRHGFEAMNHGNQVDAERRALRGRAFAQLGHQLTHTFQRVLDRHQHVLLEFRVGVQPLGVLHHQRKLRDDVLQVVHHKRRHAIERIELAHFEQGFGGQHLRQEAGRLPARRLEQVVNLPVDVDLGPRAQKQDEANQFIAVDQRNDQPRLWYRLQPGRQVQRFIALREGTVLLKVDDPAVTRHEFAQGRTGTLWLVPGTDVQSRGLPKYLRAGGFHPQPASRAFEQIGQASNHLLAHFLRGALSAKSAGELEPFFSVVVAIGEEVLVEEHPQLGAYRAGQPQDRQHNQGNEYGAELQCPPPLSAEEPDVVADAGNEDQIGAGNQQRRGMESGPPGHAQL